MGTLSFSPLAQRLALGATVLVLGLVALRCSVDIPSNQPFSCSTDADCGGEGYSCVAGAAAKFCCKADSEVCDGVDNDCNGVIDDILPVGCYSGQIGTEGVGLCRIGHRECVNGQLAGCIAEVVPSAEVCDGKDNDCNTVVDDGFDLNTDPANCWQCGNACNPGDACVRGFCGGPPPENCYNGTDDNRNGDTDCEDTACLNQLCKTGAFTFRCSAQGKCVCNGLEIPPSETAADCRAGTIDSDCDGLKGCADTDCTNKPCNNDNGCTCVGGIQTEADCKDGSFADPVDNDDDGFFNCDDTDCAGHLCFKDATTTATCKQQGPVYVCK